MGKRIVIKVGSSTLAAEGGGIDRAWAADFVRQVCELRDEGFEPIIVSSGAMAAGFPKLGFAERPSDLPSLQACAAAGQIELVKCYSELLGERGVAAAQVLLTRHDTGHRESYLHARDTFERLVELGAVAIVNENDTVAVDEIRFGDNDTLGALVATMVHADLLVLLSDIEGLYDADPRINDEAKLLEQVEELTDDVLAAAGGTGTELGSGGMITKVQAARVLMKAGIPMIVCNGRRPDVIVEAARGKTCGTRFEPGEDTLGARKLWIALGRKAMGEIVIDDGAVAAITERAASLLPAGVVSVSGSFAAGDAVVLSDRHGAEVARGLSELSSEEIDRVKGMPKQRIADEFPQLSGVEVIHRDRLAIL